MADNVDLITSLPDSPVSNNGRGLKLAAGGNHSRHTADSPVSNNGRGLKHCCRQWRDQRFNCDSPVSNNGRGLKPAAFRRAACLCPGIRPLAITGVD